MLLHQAVPPVRRKAKLILLFYRSWAVASNLVTVVCAVTLANTSVMMLPFLLLLKAGVQALIWYVMREFGSRRLYYFTNLGLTPRALWGWSMAFDLTIFAICTAAAATYNLL